MLKKRLIAVLILRDGTVVQSVQFRHTNVVHYNPVTAVKFFNQWAADEIIVLDVSRDTRRRDKFYDTVMGLSRQCLVPLTVGGYVQSTDELRKLLRLGADKVVINTQAVLQPDLVTAMAEYAGSQCVVVSIDAQADDQGRPRVVIDRARRMTDLDPVEWAQRVEALGAGEILFNRVEHDGNRRGYDLELIGQIVRAVRVPVIAFGGMMEYQHLADGVLVAGADAVAAANQFHYKENSLIKAKKFLLQAGVDVR
jgi:cyclase